MNITFIPNNSLILVTSDNKVLTATHTHPNWSRIEQAVKDNDEKALESLMNIRKSISSFGSTGKIEVKGDKIFYRGLELFGEDINRLLEYLRKGFPTTSMIKFLEAKFLNPSVNSVTSMYSFLENKGMPLTANGTVLGYKGVRKSGYSINTGKEPLISGIRATDGSIRNFVGDCIEMSREYVCADNSNACGGGLHIGSKDYAKSWAGQNGKVMIVEFSPQHVVSVPNREHSKLRVCKYRVVGELNDVYLSDTYNDEYVRPEGERLNTNSFGYEDSAPRKNDFIQRSTPKKLFASIGSKVKPTVVPKVSLEPKLNWSKGQAAGFADGKGHKKRRYYEEDRSQQSYASVKEFIDGYLKGYRDGRNG